MTMPSKIWASESGLWYDDKSFTPQAYIRADLAEELARALEHEQERGTLSVSSRTILSRYKEATE